MELLNFIHDDGGRNQYFKGTAGDCVTRSIAIASGMDYKQVYDLIFRTMGESPRNGVWTKKPKFKRMMQQIGFTWTATSGIGSHQAVHLVNGELPDGRLVIAMAKHYTAVVDNTVHDIFDPRTNDFGDCRKIYGYWKFNG